MRASRLDPLRYHYNKAVRAAMAAAWPFRKRKKETGDYMLDSVWRDIEQGIKRSKFLPGRDTIGEWRLREDAATVQAFKTAYAHLKSYSIKVGSPARAQSGRSGEIKRNGDPVYRHDVIVGWMWRRHIFEPFLRHGNFVDKFYVLLTVEEVRVNYEKVRLFEAQAYHTESRVIRRGYLAQSRVGERKAFFKTEAVEAIKLAMKSVEKTINHELTGEH